MFLPKKTILALSVMLDIAQNTEEKPISAKDLAERHGVSPRFFEVMLKNLAARGLIRGQRGPKGGYTLGREIRAIKIGEVVASVAGTDDDGTPNIKGMPAYLSSYVDTINDAILTKLNETTLADLANRGRSSSASGWPVSALAS